MVVRLQREIFGKCFFSLKFEQKWQIKSLKTKIKTEGVGEYKAALCQTGLQFLGKDLKLWEQKIEGVICN